jgi:predicted transposase YbfD/YdcC
MTHREGATIAQCDVDTKTNEITAFAPLLGPLDLAGVVITADPMHAQRSHARFLVEDKNAHFVFGLKDNQPLLRDAAEALLADAAVAYESHDRGHGRIEHRYVRVAAVPPELAKKLKFPHAAQVIAVERERADLDDCVASIETSFYVTSLSAHQAGPEQLAAYIRGHWGIENRSHWVRDQVFDEDRSSVRVGGAPQALATLRNLAISLLRLAGFDSVAPGLRWAAWDHTRALSASWACSAHTTTATITTTTQAWACRPPRRARTRHLMPPDRSAPAPATPRSLQQAQLLHSEPSNPQP